MREGRSTLAASVEEEACAASISRETLLLSLFGIAIVTLIGVGLRLVAMQTIQQRRERENRQINERLRTLIAAYKTLGGSFTGNLAVDPTHLRDVRYRDATPETDATSALAALGNDHLHSDRARRMRDAVEAALSDIILLGTEEQVRLAANAAAELAAGRHVHTHELVVSLRDFIRTVLDLDPIPPDLALPKQGPTRPSASRGKGESGSARDDARHGGGGAAPAWERVPGSASASGSAGISPTTMGTAITAER